MIFEQDRDNTLISFSYKTAYRTSLIPYHKYCPLASIFRCYLQSDEFIVLYFLTFSPVSTLFFNLFDIKSLSQNSIEI